jgi:8-oxo-dGTP diphosphatase
MSSRYVNRITALVLGTVIDEAGRVLLLKRKNEPYVGLWSMPGGKIEVGEHPDAAMRREFWEETGLTVEIDRYCGSASEIMAENTHFLCHLFRLRVIGGHLNESSEGPLQWLAPDQLSGLAIPTDIWMLTHMLLRDDGPRLVTLQATEKSIMIVHTHP